MKVNQVRAGAVLSYVSIILSTVISFVYTPIMIGRLGDSEYGVYQFVLPIISYLSLLSFGLGSAYVRYYSRFKAADDRDGMRKLVRAWQLLHTGLCHADIRFVYKGSICDSCMDWRTSWHELHAGSLLRSHGVS